mmetsp:Transcript_10527/g.14521  ORF Transcript_10527/g.14521 Transcript_10527/m.14521 type:complete len:98 (+) Transcript_10527:118-411(+)
MEFAIVMTIGVWVLDTIRVTVLKEFALMNLLGLTSRMCTVPTTLIRNVQAEVSATENLGTVNALTVMKARLANAPNVLMIAVAMESAHSSKICTMVL